MKSNSSTAAAIPVPGVVSIPLWAWAVAGIALLAVYILLQENGGILPAGAATFLHEVTHDGRHALGVPCH